MAKQILEIRIEFSGCGEAELESRKLNLLAELSKIIIGVQSNSRQYDGTNKVTIKSLFASNIDMFKELPNSLHETENKNEN